MLYERMTLEMPTMDTFGFRHPFSQEMHVKGDMLIRWQRAKL